MKSTLRRKNDGKSLPRRPIGLKNRTLRMEPLESRWMLSTITKVRDVGTAKSYQTGQTSIQVTVPSAGVGAGHSLIGEMALSAVTGAVSVSDPAGNSYSIDADVKNSNGVRTVIFSSHGVRPLASGQKITVTFPAALAKAVSIQEFAGLTALSPKDRDKTSTGRSTSPTSTFTSLTTQANELLIGAIGVQESSTIGMTPGSGTSTTGLPAGTSYLAMPKAGTSSNEAKDVTILPEWQKVSAIECYAATGTLTDCDNEYWAAAISTYKADLTTKFIVTASASTVSPGQLFSVTVTATNAAGDIQRGYTGTVRFTTSDPSLSVLLPTNYTFTAGDMGVHTFTNQVRLQTNGVQTITATDTLNVPTITGSTQVTVLGPGQSSTSLVSSANPSTYGNSVFFTATVAPVSPATGTPLGTVQFVIDSVNFGAPVPLVGGVAVSGVISTLTQGNHNIRANYVNTDGNFLNSFGTLTQVVHRRLLTVTATGINKVYDGNTTATVSLSDNRISGDVFTVSYVSANFNNKNVGTAKPVTVTGISIAGPAANNYELASTTATTTANITAKAITGSITAANKVYDGNTSATILTRTLSGVIAGDMVTYVGGTANFSDKNVGIGKTVTATGLSLSGTDAGNYTVNTTATTTANITAKTLVGSITAANKVYDGNTSATILTRTLSGVIGTDVVSYIGGTATFANKNVGIGKTVTATGLSLSGADAGNYTVNTTATTTADITAKALVGSITAASKVYDGNTSAIILTRTLSGVIGTDAVNYVGGTATFADKNVGIGKTVTATGLSLSGADAGNYTVNTTAITTANITAKALVGSITAANKIYDGNTSATILTRTLSGVIGLDVVSYVGGTATFSDPNVGVGKTVTGVGLSLSGADAGNYTVNTTAVTTADITAGAASRYVVSAPATTVAGTPFTFTVTVQDAFGNVSPTYLGIATFSSTDGLASLPLNYTFTAGDAGVHTFVLGATLRTAGVQLITATDTLDNSITGNDDVLVQAAAMQSLVVSGYPSPTEACVPHDFQVTAKDAFGNTTSYLGTVQFSSSDTMAMMPPNYQFLPGDNGTHTFSGTFMTVGTQSITATDTVNPSLTGTQSDIVVTPAPASVMQIIAPGIAIGGLPFHVTVRLLDACGNLATNYTGTVTFTSSDVASILPANYTFTLADAGVHTFLNSTTLNTRGAQTLTSTDIADSGLTATATIFVLADFFDFNSHIGGFTSPTAAGHTSVIQTDVYTPARGYGWNAIVGEYDRGVLPGIPQSDLLRDGHWGVAFDPSTFRVDLPNGTYLVTVTVGDVYTRDGIEINAEGGAAELPNINVPGGQYFHDSFTITIIDGSLDMSIRDLGGDPYWVINALEIRPVPVFGVTFTSNLGTVDADPLLPPDTVFGTAPAGSLLTVKSSIGAVVTDMSSVYQGTQVLVDSTGSFSFQLQRSAQIGTPTLTALAVDGFAGGLSNTVVSYAVPQVRRFDFDAGPTSPTVTQAGFSAVRGHTIYGPSTGAGWVFAVGEFDRLGVTGSTGLKRDGHWGITGTNGWFQALLTGGSTYDVRVYVGDSEHPRDGIQVAVEGGTFVNVPATAAGQWVAPVILGTTVSADGILDLVIRDVGGDPYWVINGVDIALSTSSGGPGLPPVQLPLLVTGGTVESEGTTVTLTSETLSIFVEAAIVRWAAAGLTPEQVALLGSTTYRVADLDSQGYLGLADPQSRHIQLDDNAAGHGWYLDDEPADDSEFSWLVSPAELRAVDNSPAVTHVDLLSVVLHELGHILGLDDLNDATSPHELMTEALGPGTRRLPAAESAVALPDLDVLSIAAPASVDSQSLDEIDLLAVPLVLPSDDLTAVPNPTARRVSEDSPRDESTLNVALAPNQVERRPVGSTIDEVDAIFSQLNELQPTV